MAKHTIKAVHESLGEDGRQRFGRGHKFLGQRRCYEGFQKEVLAHRLEMPWHQAARDRHAWRALKFEFVRRATRHRCWTHELPRGRS